MRHLFLIASAALLFGAAGCMLPSYDAEDEKQFWRGAPPRDLLQMEAKPNNAAPATTPTPQGAPGAMR